MTTVLPGELEIEPDTMEPGAIMGIYGAFDRDSGEALYVGLSEDIRARIVQHRQQLARNSKTKKVWDDCFKDDVSRVTWMLLETVADRKLLNQREHYWWRNLNPRFNRAIVHSTNYRTGGDTRRKRPSDEELQKLRNSGRSGAEIAELFGVTDASVYGWFRDMGRPLRMRTEGSARHRTRQLIKDSSELDAIEERVASGESISAVCNELRLDRKVVTNALESRGCRSKRSHKELLLREARTDEAVSNQAILASLAERVMAGEEIQAIASSEGLHPARLQRALAPQLRRLAKLKSLEQRESNPKRKPKARVQARKPKPSIKRDNARAILLDEGRLNAIEERVRSGEFLTHICRELNANQCILRDALAKRGCYSKRSQEGNKRQRTREALASDESREEIVGLVLAGSSLAKICRDFELEWVELSTGLEALGVRSAHRKGR